MRFQDENKRIHQNLFNAQNYIEEIENRNREISRQREILEGMIGRLREQDERKKSDYEGVVKKDREIMELNDIVGLCQKEIERLREQRRVVNKVIQKGWGMSVDGEDDQGRLVENIRLVEQRFRGLDGQLRVKDEENMRIRQRLQRVEQRLGQRVEQIRMNR